MMKPKRIADKKQHIRFALFSSALLFCVLGCGVQRISTTQITYENTHKEPKDTTITYVLPSIKPSTTTKQTQDVGDVSISAEIVPFSVTRTEQQRRAITYKDPYKPGYDVYEIATAPGYAVAPDIVQFKLRIRDKNENANLVLEKIAFSLLIDGVEFSFPEGYRATYWQEKSMIMAGTEETFVIDGPAINSLNNPKLIRLRLTGVPVSFNSAGVTTSVKSFEWFFECNNDQVTKEDKVTYSYETEPVYKEQCKACNGLGYYEKKEACHTCNGLGYYTGTDGKTYQCYACKGAKTMIYKYTCPSCNGAGQIAYPKSTQMPPVASSETWTGWKVRIITHPAGAAISTYDPKTKTYAPTQAYSLLTGKYSTASSPALIDWYSGEYGTSDEHPIIVEYAGQKVKVLPYKNGKPSRNIQIDFSSGTPVVKTGKLVE